MEDSDREWLRGNRHRMKLGQTDEGLLALDFDDYNIFDAMDDFLTEECALGELSYRSDDKRSELHIIFRSGITIARLETIIASI
jgi:hypothetical protein